MKRSSYREQDRAFGQLMLTLRTAIGLTQARLADRLGVSRHAVGGWEAGQSYPKAEHLTHLIELATQHRAFTPGSEAEEIRALWRAARQKVLLDARWLELLLQPPPASPPPASASVAAPTQRLDWGDALDGPSLYGRAQELAQLTQWLLEDRCRVVSVLGMGGIGKSALATRLMRQVAAQFTVVLWRSLRDAPSCERLLDSCLQALAEQDEPALDASLDARLARLMHHLRNQRVLLVLDNLETLLEEGSGTGQLRVAGYDRLLRQLAQTAHQSCLLLTSREKPAALVPLEGSRSAVRALHLAGLPPSAGAQFLADEGIAGSAADRARLVAAYQGNPLALKMVAQSIGALFGGEIAPFLAQGEVVFGGVRQLLDDQRASLIALGAVEQSLERVLPPMTIPEPAAVERPIPTQRPTSNLPLSPTSFIGRSFELNEIARILADPSCRLLTLLGPGGIGKTRLAIEAASAQQAVFPDGAVFVALAPVDTPRQVVATIGDSLGLSFADHLDPTMHLLDYLRSRHMLLVLDNFEHLLASVDLVSEILVHAPQVTLLITSRERLNVQAEWLLDIDGLAYPMEDPYRSASTPLAQYSAVELFVQRISQIQSDAAFDEAALQIIAGICRHVAGMPLAIELAAAANRSMPLGEIEQQIRENLNSFATTLRDLPPRHRSLRAVFDHSWKLLDEHERMLFSRLAVFRGDWNEAAAHAVTGATITELTTLIDKSLVRQIPSAKQAEKRYPFEPRFTLLEPLREYAAEQLVARGEAQAIAHAHASYYVTAAESVSTQWGDSTFETAIAYLQRDYDNILATLAWATENGESALGLRLANALWQFWRGHGFISDGRAWLRQLLAIEPASADPHTLSARQHALHAAAWLASDQHDYEQAAKLFAESLELRRSLGDTTSDTDLLVNAARQARAEGNYHQATALLEQALAWQRAHGYDIAKQDDAETSPMFGQVLHEMGLVLREQGHFVRATALFEESVTFHSAIGNRALVAIALIGLADVARDQGHGAEVWKYGEPALQTLRELGMLWAIGFTLHTLALGAYYQGDFGHAATLIRESEGVFRDLHADGSLTEILITAGKIEHAQGNMAAAHAALAEALRLAQAVGPRLFVAASMEQLASVIMRHGQAEQSVRLLAAASALRQQMGAPVWPADQASVDDTLATAQSSLGEKAFAETWAQAQTLPLKQILGTINIQHDHS